MRTFGDFSGLYIHIGKINLSNRRNNEETGASSFNTRCDGKTFNETTIEAVWQKGTLEPSFATSRKRNCSASMIRAKYGGEEMIGREIDHIKQVSKGGTDDLSNLRPLQWENNRAKGDGNPDSAWTCKVTSYAICRSPCQVRTRPKINQ